MDFKDTELFKLYVILFFKNIIGSMFHFFMPVFLFVNGFSFMYIGIFLMFSSLTMIGCLFFMGGDFYKFKTNPQ